MQSPIYNQNSENIGVVELSDKVFAVPFNNDLMHQVVISQMANKRQVIAHTKGRGEVRGGGRKPWKQKGTGRARHGSIRSPIWTGGGVTHGPSKEAIFKKKINSKMAQKAVCMALSGKIKEDNLKIVDQIAIEKPKTKELAKIMTKVATLFAGNKNASTLIVTSDNNKNLVISARNIPNLQLQEARNLTALELASYKNIILFKDAINSIENKFK